MKDKQKERQESLMYEALFKNADHIDAMRVDKLTAIDEIANRRINLLIKKEAKERESALKADEINVLKQQGESENVEA